MEYPQEKPCKNLIFHTDETKVYHELQTFEKYPAAISER